MRDLDVPFQECGVHERFRELVADGHCFRCARRYIAEGSIVEGFSFLNGVGVVLALDALCGGGGELGIVRDGVGGEAEFCLLLEGFVGGGGVGGEVVGEVLFVVLADLCGEGRLGGDGVEGYCEGLFGFGGEGVGEGYSVELDWAACWS